MSALEVRLTRLSNERHRFEYRRHDGSGERLEMETRSLLTHDLAHFAVELEAGLQDGFYGRLARARSYAELAQMDGAIPLEQVVVIFQGWAKPDSQAGGIWARLTAAFAATGEAPPAWIDEAAAHRIQHRLRGLLGAWRATPFGETLELSFPVDGRPTEKLSSARRGAARER